MAPSHWTAHQWSLSPSSRLAKSRFILDFSVFSLSNLDDFEANLVVCLEPRRLCPEPRLLSVEPRRISVEPHRLSLENLGVSLSKISASLSQLGFSESKLVVSL